MLTPEIAMYLTRALIEQHRLPAVPAGQDA